MTPEFIATAKLRIEACSVPVTESGCWIWERACDQGYGACRILGRTYRTHRLSWMAHVGSIPAGLHVCHKCDTRSCVNPAHLFVGTNADNMRDKMAKGRQPRGAASPLSKLTAEQAAEVRVATGSQRAIGLRFGICQAQVWRIKTGKRWAA